MNSGYYAVVLDKKSQDAVKPNATMDVVNGDHITIAYKPNDKIFKKLYKLNFSSRFSTIFYKYEYKFHLYENLV